MQVVNQAVVALLVILILSGCATAVPEPTLDIPATVAAAIDSALPTPSPFPTPDIPATVKAQVQATVVAIPSPTPTATPIPTATLRPTATAVPISIPIPSPDLVTMLESIRSGVVRIQTESRVGSGAIFEVSSDDSALLLTNYHVIERATTVDVIVGDSRTYSGMVLGTDQLRDLAVVRICCGEFEALELGQASKLRVGSEIVAVGYALGYSGSATVTRGIVSAFRYDDDKQRSVIQIDAPINPGNSGGPLFTLSGEIVGINTFKQEYTTGGRPTEGLGFAISEITIRKLLPNLKEGEKLVGPAPTPRATPVPMATSTPKPIPRGKWATYDNTTYKYRLDVPPRWTVRDSEKSSVEILSPDPEFASLNIYYMGTTVLSHEGYANKIIREREDASDGSYNLLRRSSGGFNKYKIARLDFEVRHGSGFCDALVTDLVVILKVEKDLFHLISVRNCRQGIDQYEAPLKRILDSFFLYR